MLLKKYFLILFFIPLPFFSQELYKVSFGRKDGLPSTNIYGSLSDKNGTMWFATDMGVLKYDGYTFTPYGSQNGIADDEIFNFFQDNSGRVWFYSYNGKISFLENGTFYNENVLPFLKSPENLGYISQIIENPDSSFDVIYSKGSLLNLNLKTKKLNLVKNNNKITFKFKQQNFIFYLTPEEIQNLKFKKITSLGIQNFNTFSFGRYFQWKNKLFLSQGNSVYLIENVKCKKIIELSNSTNEIIYLYVDSLNKLWIGTRLGVYIYDANNLKKTPEHLFKTNAISSINEDFEGKIWLTTLDNGIYYIPNRHVKKATNDSELVISTLGISSNNFIIGATNFDNYYSFKNPTASSKIELKNFQAKNNISQIISYDNSDYIVGKHGIRIIHKNKITDVPFIGSKCLFFEKDSVWIGATYLLKIAKEKLPHLNNKDLLSTDSRVILTEKTNSICRVENSKWIGTNNGIFIIENGKTESLSKKFPITKTIISDIFYVNNSKTVIIATQNKGLFVFEDKKIVKHYTTKNGLLSNTIFRIRKNNNQSIYLCTNLGLNSLEVEGKNFKIINLNKQIGFENFKISDVLTFENLIYLATENGLLYLPKQSLQFKPVQPKITVDLFEVNNVKKSSNQLQQLSYQENNIKIGFAGISFQTQKNIKYLYRLSGSDQNWQATKSKELIYKSLAPGDYVFEVKAVNGSGISSNTISIPINISKPFWKKLWFIIGFSLMIGFSTLYLWRRRVKQLKEKYELENQKIQTERDKANLEKQIIELEHKALRMQMNPHFIFNALNTIKGYYAEGNDDKASDYISKFSMLLRLLLENSEQLIPLATEIKMLELYIELTQIRYKNIFDFKIEVDSKLKTEDTAIPPLLLQPMVENAIIHGLAPKETKGFLFVSFTTENNRLVCIVDDNGIGLKASAEKQQIKQHQSKAIEITKERISLLTENENKSDFSIQEKFDKEKNSLGTIVKIQIPLKNIW